MDFGGFARLLRRSFKRGDKVITPPSVGGFSEQIKRIDLHHTIKAKTKSPFGGLFLLRETGFVRACFINKSCNTLSS